jgi:hypothetical protein
MPKRKTRATFRWLTAHRNGQIITATPTMPIAYTGLRPYRSARNPAVGIASRTMALTVIANQRNVLRAMPIVFTP